MPRKTPGDSGYRPDYHSPEHRKARAAWAPAVARGEVVCTVCNKPIQPWHKWDLGHDDWNPGAYSGPQHAHCNRSEGAAKGNAWRTARRTARTEPGTQPQSRDW